MNNKNIFLIAGILSLLVFIGYLGESESKTMFGFLINVWFFRIVWLISAVINFKSYSELKKSENK